MAIYVSLFIIEEFVVNCQGYFLNTYMYTRIFSECVVLLHKLINISLEKHQYFGSKIYYLILFFSHFISEKSIPSL